MGLFQNVVCDIQFNVVWTQPCEFIGRVTIITHRFDFQSKRFSLSVFCPNVLLRFTLQSFFVQMLLLRFLLAISKVLERQQCFVHAYDPIQAASTLGICSFKTSGIAINMGFAWLMGWKHPSRIMCVWLVKLLNHAFSVQRAENNQPRETFTKDLWQICHPEQNRTAPLINY